MPAQPCIVRYVVPFAETNAKRIKETHAWSCTRLCTFFVPTKQQSMMKRKRYSSSFIKGYKAEQEREGRLGRRVDRGKTQGQRRGKRKVLVKRIVSNYHRAFALLELGSDQRLEGVTVNSEL